jgi:hypothetical protein
MKTQTILLIAAGAGLFYWLRNKKATAPALPPPVATNTVVQNATVVTDPAVQDVQSASDLLNRFTS